MLNRHHDFLSSFQRQHDTRVYTKLGAKIQLHGTRSSGDVNTSLGNTAIQLLTTHWVCATVGLQDYHIYLDGDDAIVFLRPDALGYFVATAPDTYARAGLKTKIEGIATHYNELVFCSGIFVHTAKGVRHIRNPGKFLCTTPYSTQPLSKRQSVERGRQVARCAAIGHSNVPILGALCRLWTRLTNANDQNCQNLDQDLHFKVLKEDHVIDNSPPTSQGRDDFMVATKISPAEQRACEDYLDSIACPKPYQRIEHPALTHMAENYLGHSIDLFKRTVYEHCST
uniref:RNA-directed RNA polymerase n=1 Tax=Coleopteran tombus-related virus TaxID=2822551 RepID=A0A8A6RIP2_9TOMB|nr:RNA-dependent RNA polymerase [Coleopteran tombus-related virus]